MERLCMEILNEIHRKNISYTLFADLCGISRKIMADIVNREKEDVKLSTIVKICENSDIKLEDVFLKKKSEPQETYLIMNGERYLIELHKVRATPPEVISVYFQCPFYLRYKFYFLFY